MGLISRTVIFFGGTISNAILYLFMSRVIFELLSVNQSLGGGWVAGTAFDILPIAMQLAIGGIQLGLILYLIGGISQERTATRRPMR